MKIEIIGRGNVATHLLKALEDKTRIRLVNPRTLEGLDGEADLIIISVSDAAIKEVCSRLPRDCRAVVAHTSGSSSLSLLEGHAESVGVLYPMQTFSKDVPLDYSSIPFFIEGNNEKSVALLRKVAGLIGNRIYTADSQQRRALHLAAVLSCNFVNHLWALADRFMTEHGLDFQALVPLIQETMRKAASNSPADVQTGPAVRRDLPTMEAHLRMLDSDTEVQNIYKNLSESIIRIDNERNKL